MKRLYFIILLFLVTYIYSDEKSLIERINSHILIEDYASALEDAKIAAKKFSKSNKLKLKYIECLALNDDEINAIKELKSIKDTSSYDQNHDILENISWAILNKASKSSQYTTRLTTLIGVHLTHDVRAVNILNKLMRDSNAIIRTVALQLSSSYMDKPLRDTVENLFSSEKLWLVRLEVIKAIGKMKVLEKKDQLKEIIASDKSTYEEKEIATGALVNIFEDIDMREIEKLSISPKAGLRKLSLDLIAYFDVKEAKDIVIKLADDPIAEVRVAALNAMSLNFLKKIKVSELKKILSKSVEDTNPAVAITASYIAILKNFAFGEKKLREFFSTDDKENTRFAAAVLAKLSDKCLNLKKQIIQKHSDIYVKANLALGLLAEKKFVKESADILFTFLENDEKLMWENSKNPLFQVLYPSYIRHIDQIPRYPEAIDQMTRLHILSMLAILEEPKAIDGIKSFLKKKGWGITGFASAALLKEGDEEALDLVRELLNETDQDVKVQAALVLALLGKEENVISTLEKAYLDADYNMKIQILEALGHIGSKKSIKFLVDILDEPYQNLRVVAASSMIKCINS